MYHSGAWRAVPSGAYPVRPDRDDPERPEEAWVLPPKSRKVPPLQLFHSAAVGSKVAVAIQSKPHSGGRREKKREQNTKIDESAYLVHQLRHHGIHRRRISWIFLMIGTIKRAIGVRPKMMPPQIVVSRAGTLDTAWALERAHCLLFSYNLQARFLFFGEQLPAESIGIPTSCPDVRAFFWKKL